MKIGLVIYGSLETLTGGYVYDRRLVEYLRGSGDKVEVISLPWRNYAAHLIDNLRFRLPNGFDLIIEDELNHPSLLRANARPHHCPVVSLVHHLRSSEQRPAWQNMLYRQVERRYLRSVDGFIFNSRTTQDVVHALTGPTRPHLVAYPPTDRFEMGLSTSQVRERAAGAPPLRILFLGSVIPRKALHVLLRALARMDKRDFSLDIVGSLTTDVRYAAKVRDLAASLDLSPAVTFHGPLEQDALVERLRSAHVLALPSSYEGFGIVYLEGMGFGLPAIATTAGAAAEIITDGVDGFLIPPGDSAALAARLSVLANDRELLRRIAVNALQRYRRQPAWQETAGRIRQFLLSMFST